MKVLMLCLVVAAPLVTGCRHHRRHHYLHDHTPVCSPAGHVVHEVVVHTPRVVVSPVIHAVRPACGPVYVAPVYHHHHRAFSPHRHRHGR